MQQTSDHNRKAADSQTQNKVAVTSGGVGIKNGGVGGTNYWVNDRLKDVLCNMGTEPTFCNNCKWKVTFKSVYFEN